MGTRARDVGFIVLIAGLAIGFSLTSRRSITGAPGPIDPWTHVLGRVARAGAPNAEGGYASSYSRIHKSRAGAETPFVLVDAPERELALAEALLPAGFVREAAFHLRNVLAYHASSPEAPGARDLLSECRARSALEQIAPLTLILTDGNRLLVTVPARDAGLTPEDGDSISRNRLDEVIRRRHGSPVAFSLLYDAARAAKDDEAKRLYREALALVHVPALPLVRPGDVPHRMVGFVDDALVVAATPLTGSVSDFFPESEFETGGAFVANRIYYEVEAGSISQSERAYKLRFIGDASVVLGDSPDLDRARVYWGTATPDVQARFAAPDGDLDIAYDRATAAVPYLKIKAPSCLTKSAELAVKLEWSNVDRVRFRFSPVPGPLPREEGELKRHLESLRGKDLPVAYEREMAPKVDVLLPIAETGTWRVTAEAAGLSCAFFAVRADPRIDALIFPGETVLLTDQPGLIVSFGGKVQGEEKDGVVRIGPWHAKYCPAHVQCCSTCVSCAHHHGTEGTGPLAAVQIFACDGRTFFRASANPDASKMPVVKTEPFGPVLHVYADRPVYRAGDTMKFRGILRLPKEKFGRDGRYDVLPNAGVTVSIHRDKETLFKRTYTTGEFGTFAGEFTLPLSTARAEYTLHVEHEPVSASAPFEVIDYRKSDYVITLESVKGAVAVRAGYAWGAPVEGATVKAFVKDVETTIQDDRIAAAAGDVVRVVLRRGEEELASKKTVHREPAAPASEVPKGEVAKGASSAPAGPGPSALSPAPVPAAPAIRTAKKVYGRGETIEVELSGSDGEALVVLGDVTLHDWRRVSIRGGRGVARFDTTPTLDPGTTIFAVLGGSIERLPLEINAQRMRVDVVPDKSSARPGDDVGVTIRTLPGAEVSLAAVDEAIFMIREDGTPDLYGTFYPARPAAMAHAAFDSITYEGDTRLAEFLPRDPRLRPATRARDRFFRDEFDRRGLTEALGVGGGAGGGQAFGGRFGGRENLVARGGGTRATESAVLANLKRLAERQLSDGSWGPGDTKTEFGAINAVGRTALVLLSFLGAGYSHLSRDVYDNNLHFGDVVKNGLKYLHRMQGLDGLIGPSSGDFVVNHALATTALSEAYGMSATPLFKAPAESALQFLASRQAGDGGWHPAGGALGEATVTALAVMAMKSGQFSELDYGQVAAMNASRFFRTLTRADGSCPANRGPGAATTPLTTASALLSFIFLDADKKEPRLAGVKHLLTDLPDAARPDYCTWYLVSLTLFQYDGPDGPYWKKWNEPMKNALVPLQTRDGFWAPNAPPPDMICMTAIAGLTLEVYYRYANVFGAKGGGGAAENGVEARPLAPPPAIRVHFPDTAMWIPDLVTDGQGAAKATLRLPDSITTIRLTARGVTKDTAVGEGVGRVESRQPFFVNLKTPAFFVAGDEAEIRAEVFNYSGGTVETDATLSGEGFVVVGESKRRLKVGASCESVAWRVRISPVEFARFRVTTERDAVEKSVPVKPLVAPAVRSFRGPVVAVPPGEKPLDLVLRVSPKGSALSKVLEALRFLNDYPHG